jgi:hypothetical protein
MLLLNWDIIKMNKKFEKVKKNSLPQSTLFTTRNREKDKIIIYINFLRMFAIFCSLYMQEIEYDELIIL